MATVLNPLILCFIIFILPLAIVLAIADNIASTHVYTGADFVAALQSSDINLALLEDNIRVDAADWPSEVLIRNRNFTLKGRGASTVMIDFAFSSSRLTLGTGVSLSLVDVEARNFRSGPGFGLDLLTASPGAVLDLQGVVLFSLACVPTEVSLPLIRTYARPTASVVQQQLNQTTQQQQQQEGQPGPEVSQPLARMHVAPGDRWCRTTAAIAGCYDGGLVLGNVRLPAGGGLSPPPGERVSVDGGTVKGAAEAEGYEVRMYDTRLVCPEYVTPACASRWGYAECATEQCRTLYSRDITWQQLRDAGGAGSGSGAGLAVGGMSTAVLAAVIAGAVLAGALLATAAGLLAAGIRRRRRAMQEAPRGPQPPKSAQWHKQLQHVAAAASPDPDPDPGQNEGGPPGPATRPTVHHQLRHQDPQVGGCTAAVVAGRQPLTAAAVAAVVGRSPGSAAQVEAAARALLRWSHSPLHQQPQQLWTEGQQHQHHALPASASASVFTSTAAVSTTAAPPPPLPLLQPPAANQPSAQRAPQYNRRPPMTTRVQQMSKCGTSGGVGTSLQLLPPEWTPSERGAYIDVYRRFCASTNGSMDRDCSATQYGMMEHDRTTGTTERQRTIEYDLTERERTTTGTTDRQPTTDHSWVDRDRMIEVYGLRASSSRPGGSIREDLAAGCGVCAPAAANTVADTALVAVGTAAAVMAMAVRAPRAAGLVATEPGAEAVDGHVRTAAAATPPATTAVNEAAAVAHTAASTLLDAAAVVGAGGPPAQAQVASASEWLSQLAPCGDGRGFDGDPSVGQLS